MSVLLLRVIAAAVMTVIMGLPIARVVCAHECQSVVDAATAAEVVEHCHKPEATGSTTMSSVEREGCSPFTLSSAATRERANTPSSASIELPDLSARTCDPLDLYSRRYTTRPAAAIAGPSPGAPRPLRI